MPVLIECTGASGVGKTTIVGRASKGTDLVVYSRRAIGPRAFGRLHPMLGRLVGEVILWARFLLKPSISLRQGRLLFRLALMSDERLLFRLNIFRNAILKFADRSYAERSYQNQRVLIDEGISHLPFLFQYSGSELGGAASLYGEFEDFLRGCRVAVFEAEGADLELRLRNRGHRRLGKASKARIAEFVERNARTVGSMRKALESLGIDYEVLDTGDPQAPERLWGIEG